MDRFSRVAIFGASLLAISSVSSVGQAMPLTIDAFTTGQTAVVDLTTGDGGEEGFAVTGGNDILGGERDVFVEMLSSAVGNDSEAVFNTGGSGTFSFNTGSGSTAMALLQYDGVDGSMANAHNLGGMGGLDLTAFNGIQIDILGNDHEINAEIVLYSGAGNFEVHEFTKGLVNFGDTFHHVVNFNGAFAGECAVNGSVSGLACSSGTGFDLANITAIEIWIEGVSSNDLTLDFVEATVPEPATLGLFGLGLLGLGFSRRRAKAAA